MSIDRDRAGVRLARRDPEPGLGAVERRGRRPRGPPRPATSPVEASTPLGHVGGDRPCPRAPLIVGDHARDRVPRRAGRARAEQRVDDPVRAGRAARRRTATGAGRRAAARASRAASSLSHCAGQSSEHVDVAARPRAAAAPRRARRRRCCPCRRRRRSGPPGTCSATTRASPSPARSISSSDGIPASSIAQRSVARISCGVGQRLEPARAAHRSTATAPAIALECVSEISTVDAELGRARGRAAATAATLGGAVAAATTSTSCQSPSRSAERLGHRLLGAEARGEVPRRLARARPRTRARRR